jgi:hypothetical protein
VFGGTTVAEDHSELPMQHFQNCTGIDYECNGLRDFKNRILSYTFQCKMNSLLRLQLIKSPTHRDRPVIESVCSVCACGNNFQTDGS